MLAVATVILLILALIGHAYAGWALVFLLLGTGVAIVLRLQQLGQRVSASLAPPAAQETSSLSPDLQARLHALESQRRRLPAHLQDKFSAAITATSAALHLTSGGLMTRETHDARMAAEQDLPAALEAYGRAQAGGSVSYAEVLLSEQLRLIEGRMNDIVQATRQEQARELEAGRRYLQDKYQHTEGK